MRNLLCAAGVIALAACGSPEEKAGEASEAGAVIAANQPVIATRSGEADWTDEGAFEWRYLPSTRTALLGTGENEDAVLTLSCNTGMTGEDTLALQWMGSAEADATASVLLTAGEETAQVEVTGVASAAGPGAFWEAEIAPGSAVYALLAGGTPPLVLELGDTRITTPRSQPVETVLAACSGD